MSEQQTVNADMAAQLARQLASQNTPDLAKAFVAFWGETNDVGKNAKNPHLKNEYATLEAVLQVVKPVAAKYGLAFPQLVGAIANGKQQLTTFIVHSSGQRWVFVSEMHVPDGGLDKKSGERRPPGPQQNGIVIAYLRRYSLMPLAGITQTDDPQDNDGEVEETEEEDEGGAVDPGELEALTSGITAFKPKKTEEKSAALTRFESQFKDRVVAAGAVELRDLYMAKRKEIKG